MLMGTRPEPPCFPFSSASAQRSKNAMNTSFTKYLMTFISVTTVLAALGAHADGTSAGTGTAGANAGATVTPAPVRPFSVPGTVNPLPGTGNPVPPNGIGTAGPLGGTNAG